VPADQGASGRWPHASAIIDLDVRGANVVSSGDADLVPVSEATRQRFRVLRQRLLGVHTVLLDYERHAYERAHGRVTTLGELLHLVLHGEAFDWLHALSELVVRIDAMLESDELVTEADASEVWQHADALMRPGEAPTRFQQRYFAAIQSSPDIAAEHARLRQVLALAPAASGPH
jgi:hypothetical protein